MRKRRKPIVQSSNRKTTRIDANGTNEANKALLSFLALLININFAD